MTVYNWSRIVEMKSDLELHEIVDNQALDYDNEAISAAEKEIEVRMKNESFDTEPVFPEKPRLNETNNSLRKSVLSLVAFIAAFYFIFKWDLKYIIILVGILLIHELGHYIAMRLYKYKDLSIFFIPLIGAATFGQKDEISQKQNAIIALAGPLPGVVIGSILLGYGMTYEHELIRKTGEIFLYINLFNLLPVMPLDGGRIIKSLFFETNEKINLVFIVISMILIVFFALTQGLYALLIIPFFLYLQIVSHLHTTKAKQIIKNKGFALNKSFEDLSDKEYWLLRDELARNIKIITNLVTPQRYITLPDENIVINQIKAITRKKPEKDIGVLGKILFVFVWLLMFAFPIITLVYFVIVFDLSVK